MEETDTHLRAAGDTADSAQARPAKVSHDSNKNESRKDNRKSFIENASRKIIENTPRTILVNLPHPPEVQSLDYVPSYFVTNKIKTSRYTALNFLPKNIAEQYRNIANFYFTFLVIIQCFNIFETASPILNAAPIIIILIITAVKDGVEDLKRHQSDGTLNHKPTYIISNWHNCNHHADSSTWSIIHGFFHNLRKKFFKGLVKVVLSPYTLATYKKRRAKREEQLTMKRQPTRILPQDYSYDDDDIPGDDQEGKKTSGKSDIELQTAPGDKYSSKDDKNSTPYGDHILASANIDNQKANIQPPSYQNKADTSASQLPELNHQSTAQFAENVADHPSHVNSNSNGWGDDKNEDYEDNSSNPHLAKRKSSNRLSRLSFMSHNRPKEKEIFKLSQWENVQVGDFVFLRDNDEIPADIIIVSTSEQENICYVETKNLDGETNLKSRVGNRDLAGINTPELCGSLKATIDVEPPNSQLHSFNATMNIYQMKADDHDIHQSPLGYEPAPVAKQYPVNINGLLLRGCVLRNTKWVIGIVVYTGADSKIMMNAGATPSKRSRVDRLLNPQVFVNFMVLLALCLVCATLATAYQKTFFFESAPWIGNPIPGGGAGGAYSPGYTFFLSFFLSLILFQNIIPIALVISVEGTKLVQSFFIFLDEDLKDPESKRRCVPNCWNLCDDLGQIEYIFSDKTGTLTSNTMEFRKASINGVVYGGDYVTEAMAGAAIREGKAVPGQSSDYQEVNKLKAEKMMVTMSKLFDTKYVSPKLDFIDETLHMDVSKNGPQAGFVREFFTLLALCHTALIEKVEDEETGRNLLVYRSQSPDETALVKTAKDVGFTFLGKKEGNMVLDIMGIQRVYVLLNILEFDSDRKRMSVIVRRPEGDIILLCKGADSVIYERLAPNVNEDLQIKTLDHLGEFANEGLRTLCLAYKPLTEEEYYSWNEEFKRAQALIFNREEEVARISEKIETNLVLMGATAIEDKLQDGVPETIESLAQAGIKVWVLTGDKMETAINIGYACNLLVQESELITIRSDAESGLSTKQQIKDAIQKHWTSDGEPMSNNPKALIIDGQTLKEALRKSCKPYLLELGCRCRAVICCRVSPLQKAQIVRLVKDGLGSLCLAIGDGANDVSMIQAADVGIGISGKEGMQAVMASDYSIGQFRFIKRLLLVHGRWAYIRTAEMCFNYFFKNGLFLFVLFWYQFSDAFSATFVIEYTFNVFYNTIFTVLITVAIGTFDQDIKDDALMKYPRLYLKGLQQTLFTMERFWLALFDAIFQSCVVYFFAKWIFDYLPFHSGMDARMDDIGTFLAWNIIMLTNLNGANTIHRFSWIMGLAVGLTLLIWVVYCLIFVSTSTFSGTYGQQRSLFASGAFWLGFVIVVVCAMGPKLVAKYVQRNFFPTDSDIIRERSVFIDPKERKEKELKEQPDIHIEHPVLDYEHNI